MSAPSASTTTTTSTIPDGPKHPRLIDRAAVIAPRSGRHTSTIVWVHGLGDSSDGFQDLFEMLPLPETRVVLPNAPVQPVTVNGGMRMPSWYDLYSLGNDRSLIDRQDEDGILKSVRSFEQLLDEEVERLVAAGSDARHLIMGGFSQGAAMSLLTGLSSKHRLGGIVACSGYVVLSKKFVSLMSPTHGLDVPVLMMHGTVDQVVPYVFAQESRRLLEGAGLREFRFETIKNMGHSLNDEVLTLFVQWLKKRV